MIAIDIETGEILDYFFKDANHAFRELNRIFSFQNPQILHEDDGDYIMSNNKQILVCQS